MCCTWSIGWGHIYNIYLLFNYRSRYIGNICKLVGSSVGQNFQPIFSHQKVLLCWLHQLHTPHCIGPIYMTYGYIASTHYILTVSLPALPTFQFSSGVQKMDGGKVPGLSSTKSHSIGVMPTQHMLLLASYILLLDTPEKSVVTVETDTEWLELHCIFSFFLFQLSKLMKLSVSFRAN